MGFYVQILDESGAVTGEAEAHVCFGDPKACEKTLVCDDHGDVASAENPVYGFELEDGFFGAACRNAIDGDFSRLVERAELVTNPETGEKSYPWTTPDGRAVEADGTIRN